MPKFGPKSLANRATLHSKLQKIVDEAIKHIDFTILEGVRTKERQAELVKQGMSKTMNSKHIPPDLPANHPEYGKSRAMDISQVPIDWNDRESFVYLAGFIMAIANIQGVKLVWGGDWDGDGKSKKTSYFDGPHLELHKDET